MRPAGRRNVHFGAAVAHGAHGVHDFAHLLRSLRETAGFIEFRPLGNHDGIPFVRKRLPDFLGDERHERMQKLHRRGHHPHQHAARVLRRLFVAGVQADFRDFDIPVAEFIPQKIIQLLYGDAELEVLQILCNFLRGTVKRIDDPFVLKRQLIRQTVRHVMPLQVHEDKTCGVPNLVGKVAARFDLLLRIAHVVSWAVARGKRKAQRVRTVLVDDFQRVDAVAERLAHLAALFVAHQPVEKDGMKRDFAHLFHTGENHAGNPEENDVVARHERIGRVEIVEVGRFIRPAERGKRPQRRGKPCVERIGVLLKMRAAALGADAGRFAGNNCFAAVLAIPCRNAMAPPELTGNAPVLDVLHPVIIDF